MNAHRKSSRSPRRRRERSGDQEAEVQIPASKGIAGTVVAKERLKASSASPSARGASDDRRVDLKPPFAAKFPGRREARSAARREAILVAALDEFSQSGFAATRLDDVAARADVAKGTIYLYFRDKETLFQELVLAMLTPLVGTIEALGAVDMPVRMLAARMADVFVREVYETRRKDVIRLMLSEGRRFPKLSEFYYRRVLAPVLAAVRASLKRAVARGEVDAGLARFPQILVAPGLIAVMWSGLFDAYEPLDVRNMMNTQIELLFARADKGDAT